MTREEALKFIADKKYSILDEEDVVLSYEDVLTLINKIFEEPIIDCSFNNNVNSTIIIR